MSSTTPFGSPNFGKDVPEYGSWQKPQRDHANSLRRSRALAAKTKSTGKYNPDGSYKTDPVPRKKGESDASYQRRVSAWVAKVYGRPKPVRLNVPAKIDSPPATTASRGSSGTSSRQAACDSRVEKPSESSDDAASVVTSVVSDSLLRSSSSEAPQKDDDTVSLADSLNVPSEVDPLDGSLFKAEDNPLAAYLVPSEEAVEVVQDAPAPLSSEQLDQIAQIDAVMRHNLMRGKEPITFTALDIDGRLSSPVMEQILAEDSMIQNQKDYQRDTRNKILELQAERERPSDDLDKLKKKLEPVLPRMRRIDDPLVKDDVRQLDRMLTVQPLVLKPIVSEERMQFVPAAEVPSLGAALDLDVENVETLASRVEDAIRESYSLQASDDLVTDVHLYASRYAQAKSDAYLKKLEERDQLEDAHLESERLQREEDAHLDRNNAISDYNEIVAGRYGQAVGILRNQLMQRDDITPVKADLEAVLRTI